MVSKYSPLISELFMHMKDAVSVNLIDAKTVFPMYALKNCLGETNKKISIICMDERFSFEMDDELRVKYKNNIGDEEIHIEPESFVTVNSFTFGNLFSKVKELRNLERKYYDLQSKLAILDKKHHAVNERMDKIKRYLECRREIIRFDTNNVIIDHPFSGRITSSTYLYENLHEKVCKCKLLKSDGDIVEGGMDIVSLDDDHDPTDLNLVICDCTILTRSTGKLHYLVENDDYIKFNDAVAILSDPLDERKDVLQWYRDRIVKECGEERKSPKRKKKP